MTQAQFLLFLISVIPVTNYCILSLCSESQKLVNILSKFLPILFFLHLVGLSNSLNSNEVYIELIETVRGVSLGFMVNAMTLKFLFLLNFFWVVLVFYSHRFLTIEGSKNINQFKLFLALAVALVNLVLIAQNLLTTLFFYNCVVLLCHFFAAKFLHRQESKFSRIFTFLLYLESLLFFFAIVATYKFANHIDFVVGGILPDNLNQFKTVVLLLLYFSGLFLSILVPSYLLHRRVNLNPLSVFGLFFLSYAFSSLYILVRIIIFIFGADNFSDAVGKIGFHYFELILLINFLILSVFLLLSKDFKSAFFYLFFNQFTFALFAIITFALYDEARIYLTLFSFLLSMALIFLCLSNFILYLEKAENKNINGLFYDMKINSILTLFALLNLIGIAPSIGTLEKFFLLKILIKQKLALGITLFVSNFFVIVILSCRIAYLLLWRQQVEKSDGDLQLAKNIDFDSGLILTTLVTAIAAFLAIVFYPLITNFFSI